MSGWIAFPEPPTDTRTFRLVWSRTSVGTSKSYYPPVVFDHFETDDLGVCEDEPHSSPCDQECVIKTCEK